MSAHCSEQLDITAFCILFRLLLDRAPKILLTRSTSIQLLAPRCQNVRVNVQWYYLVAWVPFRKLPPQTLRAIVQPWTAHFPTWYTNHASTYTLLAINHLSYNSWCSQWQAFCNGRILPSSPAFFRYMWNLWLTVPRAPMTRDASALFSSLGNFRFFSCSLRLTRWSNGQALLVLLWTETGLGALYAFVSSLFDS